MDQIPRKIIIILITLIILFFAGAYAFANLGNWLLVSDPEPQKIDLVFSFAGGPYRDDHALELLKKHPEAKWLASTGSHSGIIEKCRKAGIDSARVSIIDTCKSTWSEIKVLKEYLKTNNWAKSIGLVSSEWHMRRILLFIFKQGVHGAYFACLPAPLEVTGPKRATFESWRKTGNTKAIVEGEIMKMGFYLIELRR
jgi:uncharacterized SAM-binding protein YcdF (DUF218 family)